MSEWKARRFWTKTEIAEADNGLAILLDDRPVRTPAKKPLVVPTRPVAEAIQREWDAQDEVIRPDTMPFTRTANSALDKVAPQKDEVTEILAAYGETDLLCYRAAEPAALVDRQAAAWDPLLDWAHQAFGARLQPTVGVVPIAQPPQAVNALRTEVAVLSPFHLAAFHDLVALSGSLVIALAVLHRHAPSSALWDASRIDEIWQAELWGDDDEAVATAALRAEAFSHAADFIALLDRPNRAINA